MYRNRCYTQGNSDIDFHSVSSNEIFQQEIKVLHDWGFTSITLKMLVEAITKGTKLPPHPILITFDDGHIDNYTNAFPIMQKYGFTGGLYIVCNFMGTNGYMNRE